MPFSFEAVIRVLLCCQHMHLGMYMGPKDVVGENRLKEWGNVASLKDTSIYFKFSIRWVGGGNSLKENRLIYPE